MFKNRPQALENFFLFVRNPNKYLESENKKYFAERPFWVRLWITLSLIAVSIVVAYITVVFSTYISGLVGFSQTENNIIIERISALNPFTALILVVFLGPLLEELAFRFPLLPQKTQFLLGSGFFGFYLLQFTLDFFLFDSWSDETKGVLFLLGLISLIIAVIMLSSFLSNQKLNSWIKSNFNYIVWVVGVLFGAIHINNYEGWENYFYLLPILVAPQLIVGFVFAYIKITFNFLWAFTAHALYNFILGSALILYSIVFTAEELNSIINILNSGNISDINQLLSTNEISSIILITAFIFFLYVSAFIIATITFIRAGIKYFVQDIKQQQ